MLPDFKLYYKTVITKTKWYWHKDGHIEQQEKIESPDICPHIYGQIIFDRGAKTVQLKKLYLKKIVLGKLDINVQKNELDSYFKICNKN